MHPQTHEITHGYVNDFINRLMVSSIFRAAFKETDAPAPEGLLAVPSLKSPTGSTVRCIMIMGMYVLRRRSDVAQQMLNSLSGCLDQVS